MGLFEGLTIPAKQVLARATDAATGTHARAVEGAHLLLGLLEAQGTAARSLLAPRLPDPARVAAEARRVTLAATDESHPQFGNEVRLVLACARGIAVGRGADSVGTGACLLALLTVRPRSAVEILDAFGVNVDELAEAASGALAETEAVSPPPGEGRPWAVTLGVSDAAITWSDERP